MAADVEPVAVPVYDEETFRVCFRAFHAQFSAAMDAGVDLGTLLAILEGEGVELPDFVRMML